MFFLKEKEIWYIFKHCDRKRNTLYSNKGTIRCLDDLVKRLKVYIADAHFKERFAQGGNFEVNCFENSKETDTTVACKPELIDMLFSSAAVQVFFEEKKITSRELDVIRYILKGFSYSFISREISRSAGTVKKHWFNALDKLPSNNKSELIILLMELQGEEKLK